MAAFVKFTMLYAAITVDTAFFAKFAGSKFALYRREGI